jgi:hypothetical protein
MRVLLTGMSATGKSTLVQELRRRGFVAYDADDDGFSEPRGDGRWGWRRELVAERLADHTEGLLFLAGCSEEAYGRAGAELAQVLADRAEIEPLLRRSADLVVMSTAPPGQIADEVLEGIAERQTRS